MKTVYNVHRDRSGKTVLMKEVFKMRVMQMKPGEKAIICRSEERGGNIVITRNNDQIEEKKSE